MGRRVVLFIRNNTLYYILRFLYSLLLVCRERSDKTNSSAKTILYWINLFCGQKQRLAIARAIAKNPDIYIFDDSFSALDYKTDATLREALKERTENKTVVIVAQRINTILNADQIIVLDNGNIVGKGTHEELMENCEEYKEIALSQLSEEELKKKGSE